ncbi:hypothetical protein [Shewanella chilikensis]|uniref:hypothetical protein n=1 Tax=Shewanella chilikensis TaxID=558541 RepID=UPI00399B8520
MTSNQIPAYTPTATCVEFNQAIAKVNGLLSTADQFHLQLYYSNVVGVMEKYLYDLYVGEIESCDVAFDKMCKLPKFAVQKYPLMQIFHQDIKAIVINSVKNMVWHRVNDLDPMFKKTFGFKINISQKLKNKLATRHHFVHRNGLDLEGNNVVLTLSDLQDAIAVIEAFVIDIDKKFHSYYHSK